MSRRNRATTKNTLLRQRQRRAVRVRNRVKRDATRPRLSVFRSHKHIYAQIIDDAAGRTLVSASTPRQALRRSCVRRQQDGRRGRGQGHRPAGLEAGVQEVVFDRREYKYHGRVAALAQAAREAGLKF